ncbi:hypothetical protein [Stenotrophomonas sp. Marseille-Q5258]|jgi:hypothetical protein|uniref:hypothetical protein n=1 Tax=Stenotrophomonas sp. Marseille-Q5258 TaxID=2972779 RepID=UPI0021C8AC38|nr:hypothetical protein [Stenotrophomonas sp. Marseille-Q5258]
MRERPILFNGAMVRAILAGAKTQTRRVATPKRSIEPMSDECPFGQPDDRLWVRERFKPVASGQVKDGYGEVRYGYAYEADSATRWNKRTTIIHDLTGQPGKGPMQFQQTPWRSSICMPHRACRLLLEITAVRVERLQAISAQDCVAEGITTRFTVDGGNDDLRIQFRELWTSTGGDWDSNPWVWVIEFKRVEVS